MTTAGPVSTFDDAYPVVLRLAGRRVLVVGGGRVAVGKVQGLLAGGAHVTVVAPDVHADMPAEAHVVRRRYRSRDLRRQHLVFAATDDRSVNQAVFDDASRRSVWVCSVDDPDRCSFALPAVHRNGPVVVAVSTSGASPTLAQAVRDRCAQVLPTDIGAIADELARARAGVRASGGSTEALHWRPLVDDLLDARVDGVDGVGERQVTRSSTVERWLHEHSGATS